MESVPVYVGLDYHSKSVQVCVVDPHGRVLVNRRCPNVLAEIVQAVSPLGQPQRLAVEACCGAADLAEDLIEATGWPVSLAHPGYVSRMKHGPDKSDFSDARLLADLCRAGYVPEVWLAPAKVRELRVLVRYRADQIGRRSTLKVRILAVLREQRIAEPGLGRWSRRWAVWLNECADISDAGRWVIADHLAEIGLLNARIKRCEHRLSELTSDDAVVQRLLELPGVGPVTAWTMRAIVGRFDRFKNGKQLSRFCALSPRNASSGERQADAGLIRAGDPLLKRVLIQASHRLQRYDRRWGELAERLRGHGKPAGVVTAAVANRWVRWMHHELTGAGMAA